MVIKEKAEKILAGIDVPDTVCLLVVCGSYAYCLADESSDLDIRGIYLNSIENLLAEKEPPTLVEQKEDVVFYPLARFMELAAKGNPNVLEWLFVPEDCLLYVNEYGKMLLENRKLFLTLQASKAYGGYLRHAYNDLLRLLDRQKPDLVQDPAWKRKVEKHGRHMLRLSYQLLDILQRQTIEVRCPRLPATLDIQENRLVLHPAWQAEKERLEKAINKALQETTIPTGVDLNVLEDLLRKMNYAHLQSWQREFSDREEPQPE